LQTNNYSLDRQQFQKCRKEGLPRNIAPRNSSGKASSSRSSASRGGKRFSTGDFDDDDDESLYSASKKRVKQEADKLLSAGIHGAGQLANASDGTRPVKMENMDGEQDMGAHVGMGIGMGMEVGSN